MWDLTNDEDLARIDAHERGFNEIEKILEEDPALRAGVQALRRRRHTEEWDRMLAAVEQRRQEIGSFDGLLPPPRPPRPLKTWPPSERFTPARCPVCRESGIS